MGLDTGLFGGWLVAAAARRKTGHAETFAIKMPVNEDCGLTVLAALPTTAESGAGGTRHKNQLNGAAAICCGINHERSSLSHVCTDTHTHPQRDPHTQTHPPTHPPPTQHHPPLLFGLAWPSLFLHWP